MPCPTFKRFPRSLEEAFGPHTNQEISEPEEDTPNGYPLLWWFAVTIIGALAVVAIVVTNVPAGVQ